MEYFIIANSFAAPTISDQTTRFVTADSPSAALHKFVQDYNHPAGLYAAEVYHNSDQCYNGEKPCLRWLSRIAYTIDRLKQEGKGHSIRRSSEEQLEVDGALYLVENPREGVILKGDE